MGVLVQNGTVVTARKRWVGDIRCRGGQIVELGAGLAADAGEERLDASGQYVFPGGVDPHVHLELAVGGTVSADDFESGTAAGLAGGTTTILDFVHPERGEDYLAALAARRQAAAASLVDYGLHMAVTWWGTRSAEWMARCVHEEGIPSFKVYLAYLASVGIDERDLERVLAEIRKLGGLLLVHAEQGEAIERLRDRLAGEGRRAPIDHARSRPPETESEATARVAALAARAGAAVYVVHVTCAGAAAAIARARAEGAPVYGETCPHYLLLDETVYERPGFEGAAYVVSPPIRPRPHQEALWASLRAGTLQVVATDHCPFRMEQKEAGRDDFRLIPGGAAGIEHRLALLYTFGVGAGRLDLQQFVDLVSTRPARLFGLYPRKGEIRLGSDADLVVWDPGATASISARTHRHRCDRSIFEGFRLVGMPSAVIARGEVRYRDGDLRVERGAGRFLHRSGTYVNPADDPRQKP